MTLFGGEGYPQLTRKPKWRRELDQAIIEDRKQLSQEPGWSLSDTWLASFIRKNENTLINVFLFVTWAAFIGAAIYFRYHPTSIG